MKSFLSLFTSWQSHLEHSPERSFYFWNSLTPRYLDYLRLNPTYGPYSENYPEIPAWYFTWDFVDGEWKLNILDSIPF